MDKGVLLFAYNNDIDYVKQAIYCASHIKQHLNLPIALVTDIEVNSPNIDIVLKHKQSTEQSKKYFDGPYRNKSMVWNNLSRSDCYDLTPFDKTIVMDTDVIIGNNDLLKCFDLQDLQISKNHKDLLYEREPIDSVSDTSIDMYWATVFYFKKTPATKIFFNLVKHIKENWNFYRFNYDIVEKNFRNDFAFSIAIHIMSNFSTSIISELPTTIFYTLDRDVLLQNNNNTLKILLENNVLCKIEKSNVHVMNKYSLDRVIDNV